MFRVKVLCLGQFISSHLVACIQDLDEFHPGRRQRSRHAAAGVPTSSALDSNYMEDDMISLEVHVKRWGGKEIVRDKRDFNESVTL